MASRKTIAFVAVMTVSGSAVAALSLRGEPPRRLKYGPDVAQPVAPAELADWMLSGRRDFAVVDLRDDAAYRAGHVRDAEHCGSCHEDRAQGRAAMEEHFVDLSKKVVLYTQTGKESVELPKMLAKNPRLHVLEGGYAGWQREVLAPVSFDDVTTDEELAARRRREAVRAHFAGERAVTATPAKLPVTPIRRTGAHAPAAAREGC